MLLQGDWRGQQAPKTKSRGAGMPWGCTRSVPSPTGHLAPARPGVRWQPTARKPGWTSREGRATAWTGAAGPQGPRATCPTLGNSGEATQRGRGMRQPATSSMLLASSLVNTGEPARDVKAGGAEAWGNPDATPRPTRQSKRAEASAGGEGAHRAKALRARGGKQDKGPQRTRQAVHGACPVELAQGTFPIISLWREPYEANVSRTGLTGGMGRRAVRERALILPTWPGWHHHMTLSLIAV